jgi:hypothetical protein
MANSATGFGLAPVQNPTGGDGTISVRTYKVAAAYTTAIFKGALVMQAADGSVVLWTAGNKALGVAAQYRAGAATVEDTDFIVYDDPTQLFLVKSDDNTITDLGDVQGSAFGVSAVSNETNADGTVATGLSTMKLDGSTGAGAATTTLVLYGIDLSRAVDDDPSLTANDVVVRIAPIAHVNSGVVS